MSTRAFQLGDAPSDGTFVSTVIENYRNALSQLIDFSQTIADYSANRILSRDAYEGYLDYAASVKRMQAKVVVILGQDPVTLQTAASTAGVTPYGYLARSSARIPIVDIEDRAFGEPVTLTIGIIYGLIALATIATAAWAAVKIFGHDEEEMKAATRSTEESSNRLRIVLDAIRARTITPEQGRDLLHESGQQARPPKRSFPFGTVAILATGGAVAYFLFRKGGAGRKLASRYIPEAA